MAEKNSKPKGNRQPTEVDYNRPYVTENVLLGSHTAQEVFRRTYENTEKALFSLSVIVRTVGNEDSADEVSQMVSGMQEEVGEELQGEIKRLDVVIEANEVKQQVKFTEPATVEAPISSPQVGRYLALIRDVDKVVTRLTVLWLTGLITDSEYNKQCYRWIGRFRRLSIKLRNMNRSAVRRANQQRSQAVSDARKKAAEKEKRKSSSDTETKAA